MTYTKVTHKLSPSALRRLVQAELDAVQATCDRIVDAIEARRETQEWLSSQAKGGK